MAPSDLREPLLARSPSPPPPASARSAALALLRRLLELLRNGWLAVLERVAAFLDCVHRWVDERLLAAGASAAGRDPGGRRAAPVPVSALSAAAKRRLAAYCLALREPYDRENPEHARRLEELWGVEAVQKVLRDELGRGAEGGADAGAGAGGPPPAAAGGALTSVPPLPPSRRHVLWKALGWQSDDPARDFRASGLLSLQSLTWFARERPDEFVRLASKRTGRRAEWEYPFATAGVGLTVEVAAIGGVLGAGAVADGEGGDAEREGGRADGGEAVVVRGRSGIVGTEASGESRGSASKSAGASSSPSASSASLRGASIVVHGRPAPPARSFGEEGPRVSGSSSSFPPSSRGRASAGSLVVRFVAVPLKVLGAAASLVARAVAGTEGRLRGSGGSRGFGVASVASSSSPAASPSLGPPPPAYVAAGLQRLLESTDDAFEELLAASLVLLDRVWLERGASYLEFGPVFSETRERIGKLLDDPELSVERLRSIGEEGEGGRTGAGPTEAVASESREEGREEGEGGAPRQERGDARA